MFVSGPLLQLPSRTATVGMTKLAMKVKIISQIIAL